MSEPILLTSGQFSLYQTPKGGMHLSLLVQGETEPRHVEIPSMMVKMMMRKTNSSIEAGMDLATSIRTTVLDGVAGEE